MYAIRMALTSAYTNTNTYKTAFPLTLSTEGVAVGVAFRSVVISPPSGRGPGGGRNGRTGMGTGILRHAVQRARHPGLGMGPCNVTRTVGLAGMELGRHHRGTFPGSGMGGAVAMATETRSVVRGVDVAAGGVVVVMV